MKKKPSEHKKKSGKTRRGAKHEVNPTRMSKALYLMAPAQYRRFHLGAVAKPNREVTNDESKAADSAGNEGGNENAEQAQPGVVDG